MAITRGQFLRSLGKSLPGVVASTGVVTAAEALIQRVAQAAPPPVATPASPVPFFTHGPEKGNRIALTFDDGPIPDVTEIILDELKKRDLRATFFMIGQHVAAAPELARRVLAEGHEIGNHTYTHPKLTALSDRQVEEEIRKTEAVFADALAYKAAWLRPPYAVFRQNQAPLATRRQLGVAMWSVDSEDWKTTEAPVVDTVLTQSKAGSIILCHELSRTAEHLGKILDGLKTFEFVTISSLLKEGA